LAAAGKPGKRRPNVLFLMSDDMRVELGCYASRFGGVTPNLDALAGSGVRFERNYCQIPDGKNGAMLFDPRADPQELKNLADDPQYASMRAELSGLTRKYAAKLSGSTSRNS